MPLDALQVEILEVLLPNRSPSSAVAGGSVLHRHAFRLSDDHDFFHPDGYNISRVASDDIRLLQASGYGVEVTIDKEGMVEAIVSFEGKYPTKLQWVLSGTVNYFSAVPDDLFGWRLHMVDIAVNKVLAAATRHEARDFVDLALIHRYVLPLWHAIWAAPGKDSQFNPGSLIERISRNNHFSQVQMETAVDSLIPINATEVHDTVHQALQEAVFSLTQLPSAHAGKLFVSRNGYALSSVDDVIGGITDGHVAPIVPVNDGSWPSGPEIDRLILERIIERFGPEGSEADKLPSP